MHFELNPVLLLLVVLLLAVLAVAFVRWAGWKGWVGLGGLLLVCAAMNPGKADHVAKVQRQARAVPASGTSTAGSRHLMAQFKSGQFDPLADYHDLGIASVVAIQGKILSFGALGQVWVVELQRLAYRPGAEVAGHRRADHLAGS